MVTVVVALVTGVLGAIFSPLIHWSIEKRRIQMANRKEKISAWRAFVAESFWGEDRWFARSDQYAEMRPYLTPEEIARLEGRTFAVHQEGRNQTDRTTVADAIARVEKDWGLL